MKINLQQSRKKVSSAIQAVRGIWLTFLRLLREQFNKNIYTRILFTNVTAFFIGLIVLMMFSSFVVKQVTYDQVQQELIRKAKRVNFALSQQTDQVWGTPLSGQTGDQEQGEQEFLKFLADIFDVRITIFDREGNIADTSARQEVVPGSKIEEEFTERLSVGETSIIRKLDKETGQPVFIAVVTKKMTLKTVSCWKQDRPALTLF